MIHINTNNYSALKMYKILKSMGVKNSTFFLVLYDKTLDGVDPLDEDSLTEEIKIRIHREIARNPWYFLREVCRIPAAGLVPFEFNRGNLAICWAMLTNLDFVALLPRQCYKTFTVASVLTWFLYWGTKQSKIMQLTHSDSLARSNTGRIKSIRDNLPNYLKLHSTRYDTDNATSIGYKKLDNTYEYKVGPKSQDDANKVGRGFSIPIYWIDELFFVSNIDLIYDVSILAYKTIAQRARESGLPFTMAMTTTTGYLNQKEGRWGYKFLNEACTFTEHFYDMDISEIRKIIKMNSKNNILRIEYMYYDLGKGDNYLQEMKEASTNMDSFDREVLNMWKDVDTNHPLGQNLISRLIMCKHQPKDAILVDKLYILNFYKNLDELDFNIPYILGLDTSGNLNGDFTTLVAVDPRNFEVVAVLRANSYRTTRFARVVAAIMTKIFPSSVLVPERNNMGIAIVDVIADTNQGMSKRIYHDANDKPGLFTDKNVRSQLFDDLLRPAIENDMDRIHDANIISEITTLERTRSGRIDHKHGYHDDTLISYLIARWFLIYAHKKERYVDMRFVGSSFTGREREDAANVKEDRLIKDLRNSVLSSVGESTNDGELMEQYGTEFGMDRITDEFYKATHDNNIDADFELIDPSIENEEADPANRESADREKFLRTERETEEFFSSKKKKKYSEDSDEEKYEDISEADLSVIKSILG